MKAALIIASLFFTGKGVAIAQPLHDQIPEIFRGTWAPTLADCSDPEGVNQVYIDGTSVNYYEANDYLLIGVKFEGGMTKPGGSGSLFNGRFTSRSEVNLLGENNIRMEIDDQDKDVLLRYPIGDDGEPIANREVKDVRCIGR
jgi:hypothetical protein